MDTTADIGQRKKQRSPSYPSIDLGTAVRDVAKLYGKPGEGIKRNATPTDVAMSTMGYMPKSSKGMRALAAMISYGLLAEEGAGLQRTVRLTEAALDLQFLADDDPERIAILKEMAMRPKIFKEIIEAYPGELPNDLTIERYLVRTKGFNPEAVRTLIRAFRATYQYVNLGNPGILSEDEGGEESGQESLDFPDDGGTPSGAGQQRQSPPSKPPKYEEGRDVRMNNQEGMRTLSILLPEQRIAFLDIPTPASASDIRFMVKYLALMEETLVFPPPARTAPRIRFGEAMWHGPDTDQPVKVIGYWGERDGQHYVEIEGSNTGVPFDEIEYDEQ